MRSRITNLFFTTLISLNGAVFSATYPLQLLTESANHIKAGKNSDGSWTLTTTGGDPHVSLSTISGQIDDSRLWILSFEYIAPQNIEEMEIFFYPPDRPFTQISGLELNAAKTWTRAEFNIKHLAPSWDQRSRNFRLDFGAYSGSKITIRNVKFYTPDNEDLKRFRAEEERERNFFESCYISLVNVQPKNSAMETVAWQDGKSAGAVMSVYRYMHLDALTKLEQHVPSAKSPVPLAPVIAAGEGKHPDNHTVVRIFSPYQVMENQFLAWPPEITGGVGVEAVSGGFAAWPLMSEDIRALRIFNRFGGLVNEIKISEKLSPPYTVCAVKTDGHGDVLAVASYSFSGGSIPVLFYSVDGNLLGEAQVPAEGNGKYYTLLSRGNIALLQDIDKKTAYEVSLSGVGKTVDFGNLPNGAKLFSSVYNDRAYNAGAPQKTVSTVYAVGRAGGAVRELNAGRMENTMWLETQIPPTPDGKFIKTAATHVRKNGIYRNYAMTWSPLVQTGDIENKTYEQWMKGVDWVPVPPESYQSLRAAFPVNVKSPAPKYPLFKDYDAYNDGFPASWFVPFSQRWPVHLMEPLIQKTDSKTGLPMYLALSRRNEFRGGGYLGERLFEYGSLNLEQEALDHLYHYGQREFWNRLSPLYRANPEMTTAVKASHENEITSGPRSAGDYHPKSIEGFYQYLLSLYGDLENINRVFNTSFTLQKFDAPRSGNRGKWDEYDPSNPFFNAWIEYNRTVVYRRLGLSYRDVLLAGFPPELIKGHQIPDTYAVNNIGIGDGEPRVSPIDWTLTAGTGFGYTRYGVDFRKEHNIAQGAYSSGFDNMFNGEYASLTTNLKDAYEQLQYLREHSVSTYLVMFWPTNMIPGANEIQYAALEKLVKNDDKPMPGLAGGINEIRPYRSKTGAYDIAALGTQDSNTGLLKSLRADGSFEGTVYLVPFHAHVDIKTLVDKPAFTIPAEKKVFCNISGLRAGSMIEISFVAEQAVDSGIELQLIHNERTMKNCSVRLDRLTAGQHVRVVYQVPLILDDVTLNIAAGNAPVPVKELKVYHQQEMAISTTLNILDGKRHQGGVTFAVLAE